MVAHLDLEIFTKEVFMFGRHKLPDDVKQYQKASSDARKNWAKYKDTGNPKFHERAQKNYDTKRALEIKMSNPGTNVKKTNITVKDSFNKSKTNNVKVSSKISIKKSK